MSRKKIWVLAPLGLLLVSLAVLAGCRPSTALTRMMNAMNALNPGTEETMTEEEQEEQESSDQVDPMDEEEENAKIEELDELIGQLLENMDQEEAEEAVKAMYAAAAQAHEWGSQEYNPENLDTSTDSGALALNIWDDVIRSESNLSNGYVSSVLRGTGIVSTEGVVSSSGGTASGGVSIRPGGDGDGSGNGGGGDSSDSYLQGVDRDKEPTNDDDVPADTITDTGVDDNSSGGGSPGGDDTSQPPEEETPSAPSPSESEPEPSTSTTQKDPDEFKSDKPGGVSGHKIAAAGDAALMVCMLGGADRLVATSPDFLNNSYIQQGFNSGGQLNDCATLWTDSGDGSWEMSETEFIYLMQVVQPDVCIEVSGSGSFSEEQLDRMINWYGVSHYVVAAPNTGDSIVGNSSTNTNSMMVSLASIMDESESEKTAQAIANEYVDFYYNTILGHVKGTTPQRTVFIEDWDYDAQVVFNEQDQYGPYNDDWVDNGWQVPVGSGCAVIKIGWGFRPLREFLVDADVYDWAVFPATIYTSNEFNEKYGKGQNIGEKEYLQYCWFQSTANENNGYPTKSGDLCYVTPVFRMLKGTMVSNSYNGNLDYERGTYYSGLQVVGGRDEITEIDNENTWKEYGRIVNGDLSFGFIHPGYTGDRGGGSFVYVIAKNQAVAQELENQKGNSSSAWYVSGSAGQDFITKAGYGYGSVEEYGTLVHPPDLGNLIDMSYYTTVEGDYTILTNPTGLFCDWVDGSPESILETAWAACEIQHCQGYDEAALRQDIHDFYQKFYGLDIGLYSTEMNTILAGPVS